MHAFGGIRTQEEEKEQEEAGCQKCCCLPNRELPIAPEK